MRLRNLFAVAALLLASPAARAATFYVAPGGADANPGTEARPFATLTRARDAIRELKKAAPLSEAVTVYLRGGAYELPQGIKFETRDGGSAAAPITYRAYPNETPILYGGRAITGFKPWKGEILRADLGAQGFKGVRFGQLIFAGKRQHLARYPNFDPQNPYGGGWAYTDGKLVPMYKEIPGEDRRSFTCKAQDMRRWARPEQVRVFVFPRYNWWNSIIPIKSIDPATRRITLTQDAAYEVRPGDRYFFENALEELDAPGEWYLDDKTETLYFWPPAPLASGQVMAPTTRTVIELGPGVQHVTLRGLTVECAEGTAVALRGAKECRVAACTIRNVGDYHGNGVSLEGGESNGVVGCDIHDTGSSGVAIGGGDRIRLVPAGNYADNNYIHHVGVYYKQGVGIGLTGAGNRATHNLIHDGPRMGIMFSGNNLLIEYNEIRHMNLETEDTGAVYTGGRDWLGSRGTVIRYNYFHDILGYGHDEKGVWHSPYFAWGVYLDDNTGGVDVIGNIVARCQRAGIHLHNGRDNRIENNVFAESELQQMECSGWTKEHRYWANHLPTMIKGFESVMNQPAWQGMRNMKLHPKDAVLPDGTIMANNEFLRNIITWSAPKAKYVSFKTFSYDHNKCDQNLVWHGGQPVLTGVRRPGKAISGNLATNPGFEQGAPGAMPADWSWQVRPLASAKAVVAEGDAAEGRRAVRIEAAFAKEKTRDNAPIICSKPVALQPGHSYRLSAKLKADHENARASFWVHHYTAGVHYWGSSPTDYTVGREWKECTATFRIPGPGEPGYKDVMKTFRVSIGYKDETGALLADDVQLTEVETLDEWASWQAAGMDRNSVVADPLFVDAAHGDWRLKPESPAFKLGFKPIPVEKIGPYADELRASWPIVQAEGAREKPLSGEKGEK